MTQVCRHDSEEAITLGQPCHGHMCHYVGLYVSDVYPWHGTTHKTILLQEIGPLGCQWDLNLKIAPFKSLSTTHITEITYADIGYLLIFHMELILEMSHLALQSGNGGLGSRACCVVYSSCWCRLLTYFPHRVGPPDVQPCSPERQWWPWFACVLCSPTRSTSPSTLCSAFLEMCVVPPTSGLLSVQSSILPKLCQAANNRRNVIWFILLHVKLLSTSKF